MSRHHYWISSRRAHKFTWSRRDYTQSSYNLVEITHNHHTISTRSYTFHTHSQLDSCSSFVIKHHTIIVNGEHNHSLQFKRQKEWLHFISLVDHLQS
jgi:hypothetical protein